MPTIIDSLVVALKLDSKDLSTKTPATTKQLKAIETQANETTTSVDNITSSLTKFLALLGGTVALKNFISDFIDTNAQLERFSRNIGLSLPTVSAWGNAVEEVGGSARDAQGTLDMLSKAQTELMLTGQSSLIPYLSALGVSLADVTGKARPVDQVLLDLADRFSHMDRTQANNLGRMMGIDQNTLNLLLQGRKEVELTIQRQKDYAASTKQAGEIAVKFQRQIVDLKQNVTAFGRGLLIEAAPAIERILQALESLVNWAIQNREFLTDFFKIVAVGLAAIGIASAPINLTVAALLALGAAIALVWQDYQTWKRGGDSLIPWDKWKPEIDAAVAGIKTLGAVIRNELAPLGKLAQAGGKLLSGDFSGAKKAYGEVGALKDPIIQKFTNGSGGKTSLESAIGKVEGFYAKTGNKPKNRPQRNHNPGDIEFGPFAQAHGATGTDGRFAIFPDDATGFAALTALLQTKGYSNLNIGQAITKFAPPKENNTAAYIKDVTRSTGLKPTDIVGQHVGSPASGGGGGDIDKSVTVGTVTINTQATDAPGIARDFAHSMYYLFTGQANAGLQ